MIPRIGRGVKPLQVAARDGSRYPIACAAQNKCRGIDCFLQISRRRAPIAVIDRCLDRQTLSYCDRISPTIGCFDGL
jgi:hypothetical protein